MVYIYRLFKIGALPIAVRLSLRDSTLSSCISKSLIKTTKPNNS